MELTRMIDVGDKTVTKRRAVATGCIWMNGEALGAIRENKNPKGNVLAMAQAAGIMAAKQTGALLPLCHPLTLDGVHVECEVFTDHVRVSCIVKCEGKTGVEMEALTGVNGALLCIYDMSKIIDPAMTVGEIRVLRKEGGKTGDWTNPHVKSVKPSTATAEPFLRGIACGVITISDRCSEGLTEDVSGKILQTELKAWSDTTAAYTVVPDDIERIQAACRRLLEQRVELIFTTGGTGLSPRDVTPQALQSMLTYEIPGFGELLRSSGARHTDKAWLSRSVAGVIGHGPERAIVIALPGSERAVREGLDALRPLLPHALHILRDGKH